MGGGMRMGMRARRPALPSQPSEPTYFTDESGNRLTDPAGNRLTQG